MPVALPLNQVCLLQINRLPPVLLELLLCSGPRFDKLYSCFSCYLAARDTADVSVPSSKCSYILYIICSERWTVDCHETAGWRYVSLGTGSWEGEGCSQLFFRVKSFNWFCFMSMPSSKYIFVVKDELSTCYMIKLLTESMYPLGLVKGRDKCFLQDEDLQLICLYATHPKRYYI